MPVLDYSSVKVSIFFHGLLQFSVVFQLNLLLFVYYQIHCVGLLFFHFLQLVSALLLHELEFCFDLNNSLLVVFRCCTGFLPPHVNYCFHVLSLLVLDLFQFNTATNVAALSQQSGLKLCYLSLHFYLFTLQLRHLLLKIGNHPLSVERGLVFFLFTFSFLSLFVCEVVYFFETWVFNLFPI